ncbi:uncharacterized protein LOC115034286 isoform X2 [Acyrthosiphon pisum]|uniref:Odorant receptor n=1 Tax=Acyrthosiphon pisum TaxID=7029 RepID=A0A8R2NVJ2_ACYPI|nr:uncharacterized protein LOC115034286 isoform X2 [Acyrthosiphon pisum]
MDIWNENNHVFNIRLAKLIGLFQILNPGSIKFLGRNVYHIVVAINMLFVCIVAMVFFASGVYYWSDGVLVGVDYGWKGITALFLTYKMWKVVYHSNDIWDCLTITRYDFTSQNLRDRQILDRWRERSVWITNTMAIAYLMSLVILLSGSLMFRHDTLTVKNHDGSVGNYRQNIMNLYFIVTDETYNAHYKTFYFIEMLFTVGGGTLFTAFDVLLVTLCLAISCQFQVVNAKFESVGYKSLCDSRTKISERFNHIRIVQQ